MEGAWQVAYQAHGQWKVPEFQRGTCLGARPGEHASAACVGKLIGPPFFVTSLLTAAGRWS